MDEHTQGSLSYRPAEFDDWGFVRDTQGHVVAIAKPGKFLSRDEENRHRVAGTDPSEANARRLVACWNACCGISTKDLEEIAAHRNDEDRLEALANEALLASDPY